MANTNYFQLFLWVRFDQDRLRKKGQPPFNLTLMKGPIHIAASRGFAEFIFEDKRTQVFLQWLNGTLIPDETFYATVNNNPLLGAPGGFHGKDSILNAHVETVCVITGSWGLENERLS